MESGLQLHAELQFHGAEPRTREQRLASLQRESVERAYLRNRRGGFHSYKDVGNPVVPVPGSPLYAPEDARFSGRGVAEEMREAKLRHLHKHEMLLERKRQVNASREQQRWKQHEVALAVEEERTRRMRELGLRGKQNRSSAHFNIISLDYHKTPEGQLLAYKDEVTRYRAVLRSQNLFNRGHSVAHNIITGAPRANPVGLPHAPVPPSK